MEEVDTDSELEKLAWAPLGMIANSVAIKSEQNVHLSENDKLSDNKLVSELSLASVRAGPDTQV